VISCADDKTFIFEPGYGNDAVHNYYGGSAAVAWTLKYASITNPNQLTVSYSGNNVILTNLATGEQTTLCNFRSSIYYQHYVIELGSSSSQWTIGRTGNDYYLVNTSGASMSSISVEESNELTESGELIESDADDSEELESDANQPSENQPSEDLTDNSAKSESDSDEPSEDLADNSAKSESDSDEPSENLADNSAKSESDSDELEEDSADDPALKADVTTSTEG
jgi:hypothetical protein